MGAKQTARLKKRGKIEKIPEEDKTTTSTDEIIQLDYLVVRKIIYLTKVNNINRLELVNKHFANEVNSVCDKLRVSLRRNYRSTPMQSAVKSRRGHLVICRAGFEARHIYSRFKKFRDMELDSYNDSGLVLSR